MKRAMAMHLVLAAAAPSGCIRNDLAKSNVVTAEPEKHTERMRWELWLRSTYSYPVLRLVIPPAGEATNLDERGRVPTGSFFVDRDIARLTPEEIERGPCAQAAVVMPVTVMRIRAEADRLSFIGTDATGRTYVFKLDLEKWPELLSGADVVADRLLWALGYYVPGDHPCIIQGTGDPRFDGHRALASEFIEGKLLGYWYFRDAYRRREMRALKVASAWVNNTDMNDYNTLTVWCEGEGRAYFYILDFDNALGAITEGPKGAWRGWKYAWDVLDQWKAIGTLGISLCHRPYLPASPVVSPAVGRFDSRVAPRRWKPASPNYAFQVATDADGAWMAERLAQFTAAQIRAAVQAAHYSKPSDEDYLVKTLLARRDAICRAYGVPAPKSAE